MKKRILAALLASAVVLSVAGCSETKTPGDSKDDGTTTTTPKDGEDGTTTTPAEGTDFGEQGKVFNVYAWNTEYQFFFEKYYAGTMPVNQEAITDAEKNGTEVPEAVYYDKAIGIPEGIEVKWTINPSDDGVYQNKLDEALLAQATAADDEKIDMFLAEADYIPKYVQSDATMDISTLGINKLDTQYQYTVDACTDLNGVVKGVSFQCCPAAVIYRRSIAKDVLGTDDPAKVQEAIGSWDKFDEVAKTAKEKGYYMTASYVETYRTFSNNATTAWVDADKNINIDENIKTYIAQAKTYLSEGYTLPAAIWSDEKNAQMAKDGKTMCYFGPAWYYNFSMGSAQDSKTGCSGDWAICEGPQSYFWGGTWLLAATGTDNEEMLASIFTAFTANEDVCSALVENEHQFTNNSNVNEKYAADPDYGNAFLGGQNDTAVYVEFAKNIQFKNKTIYDQLLNEKLPSVFLDYFNGKITEEEAYANFYQYVNETYADIVTPAA